MAEFDRLNSRPIEHQTLKRDADSDRKPYEELVRRILVRRIKEASINASFQNSATRVAGAPRPGLKPVSPKI